MLNNKLEEEQQARNKQLHDMLSMKQLLREKIEILNGENELLKTSIQKRKDILDIKTGKLEYILEEKEGLFNKLHNELAENKELKEKLNLVHQKKSKGFFSSLMGYFHKEDLDNISTSKGNIKKHILVDNKKTLIEGFENSDSFMPDFDKIDFNKIRLDIDDKNIPETEKKDAKDTNKEDKEERANLEMIPTKESDEDKIVEVITNNIDGYENHKESEESEEDDDDDDEEDGESIVDLLRKNLNAIPE
jgi:hypothetical protein